MVGEENKALVRLFNEEFWNKGNMEAADELMAANATIVLLEGGTSLSMTSNPLPSACEARSPIGMPRPTSCWQKGPELPSAGRVEAPTGASLRGWHRPGDRSQCPAPSSTAWLPARSRNSRGSLMDWP